MYQGRHSYYNIVEWADDGVVGSNKTDLDQIRWRIIAINPRYREALDGVMISTYGVSRLTTQDTVTINTLTIECNR